MIMRGVIRFLNAVYPYRYTDTDPYKHVLVRPVVDRVHERPITSSWVDFEEEWDEDGNHFIQRTYPKAIEQRFVEGLDWEETALVDKYASPDLEKRATAIERLHRSIRDDGYKSQRELLEETPELAWNGCNDAMQPLANEIAIDISPEGELLWNMCGQH